MMWKASGVRVGELAAGQISGCHRWTLFGFSSGLRDAQEQRLCPLRQFESGWV